MNRYWYHMKRVHGDSLLGWAFGESFEEAAQYAVTHERRFHPDLRGPLTLFMQHDTEPVAYATVHMHNP